MWCVLGKTVCYLFRWFWCRVIVQYTRTIRWYTWRRAYQHSSMNKQDGWMHSTPTQWQPLSLFNQYIRMGRKMSLWFWQWCTHEPIFTLILFITVVFLSGLSLLLMCFFFAFSYLSSMIIIYNCLSRIKEKGVYTWLVIFVVVCSSLVDSHTHGGITKLAIIKRKNVCIHEMRNKKLWLRKENHYALRAARMVYMKCGWRWWGMWSQFKWP